MTIREFRPADYDRVMELWTEGGLPLKPEGRDSRDNIVRQIGLANVRFLVAEEGEGGRVVGTVLATHDGRKGWINRVAVDATLRKRGLGARLVGEAERDPAEEGPGRPARRRGRTVARVPGPGHPGLPHRGR
ncbi:MAG: hypothetical protein H6P95_2884 [Candidatus Aminicenantes bacterium]|nr:hypothetical protein [Candidatus Aminicenantes bacterium]